MKLRCALCCLVSAAIAAMLLAMSGNEAGAAEKIDVLIVDGQNNHDFERTTPYLKQVLESTGRFRAFVVTTPPKGAEPGAWKGFRPQFADYDVVLSNYNGDTWPEHARTAYEEFVLNGGGVMNVHAANNPFPDWPRWNEMTGLAWRPNSFGDRITVDADGKQIRTAKGEGPGAGHGSQHAYSVITRDREHPITKGLPAEWMHPQDELYHGQRGPGMNMNILATAFSSKESGGTGDHEPMVWWIPAGKGRVVTTVLGHVGRGQDPATWPMRCAGFHAIVTRGTEWAATGEVTVALPAALPTATEVKLVE